MGRTHWIGNMSKDLLSILMEVLIQRWLHATSSDFFLRERMWKCTPTIFSICAPTLLSFLPPLFLQVSKKMLESKSWSFRKEMMSLGGHQAHCLLCSHHWCHLCSSCRRRGWRMREEKRSTSYSLEVAKWRWSEHTVEQLRSRKSPFRPERQVKIPKLGELKKTKARGHQALFWSDATKGTY